MGTIIQNVLNFITGNINTVKKWIGQLIAAVYDFIAKQIRIVEANIVTLYNDLLGWAKTLGNYLDQVATYAENLGEHVIKDLINWANDAVNTLDKGVTDVLNYTVTQLKRLEGLIQAGISDVVSWVIKNIWNPLYDDVTGVLHWITHEGAYIYDLITHPEKLVTLLGSYLWQSWLNLLKKYSGPIAKWLLKSMLSESSAFADVIETIISHMM